MQSRWSLSIRVTSFPCRRTVLRAVCLAWIFFLWSAPLAAQRGRAGLPACLQDLDACEATASGCQDDLTTCSADLQTCVSDLGIASADLASCNADVLACGAELQICGADLGSALAAVAACDADLNLCDADLDACDASLSSCNSNLTSCNASLSATSGALSLCQGSLSACQADRTGCYADLSACQAELDSTCPLQGVLQMLANFRDDRLAQGDTLTIAHCGLSANELEVLVRLDTAEGEENSHFLELREWDDDDISDPGSALYLFRDSPVTTQQIQFSYGLGGLPAGWSAMLACHSAATSLGLCAP